MQTYPVKKSLINIFSLLIYILLFAGQAHALKFNEKELIILQGSDRELAADEGYLFLSVESKQHFTTMIIDRVESGKRMKFTDLAIGENYALVKLKAGKYYWKSIRGHILFGLSWFHFDEDEYVFEVKPGVVNYPGTWRTAFKFTSGFRGYFSLDATNKAAIEWPYFRENYSQFTGRTPLEYTGHAEDHYFQFLPAMLDKYQFKGLNQLDYRKVEEVKSPINLYNIDKGVEKQLKNFPRLKDYLAFDSQISGEINPEGIWILLSSRQEKKSLIEVVNINTLKSFVVFKELLPEHATISNLRWIDNNSFIYDLDYNNYSFSHVMHLQVNDVDEVNSAELIKIPIAGHLLDPLIDRENMMFFTNFRMREVNNKKLNGLYLVDTSSKKSVKKSFKKKYKKTKKFDRVVDWLTDETGYVRSAIEVEYDKKNERVLYHHWFLPDRNTDDWVKIKTIYENDDIPLPAKLSKDESFFYAFTDNYSDKVSVHKYSVIDYAHMGASIEDPDVNIESLIEDPTTREIIGYAYLEDGLLKRKYLAEGSDLIKQLRQQNPNMQLYVRQYLHDKGLMLLYATTQHSKGSWYLYESQSGSISKLLDENPAYENLPKGDNYTVKATAVDGVEIEGYLVVPSIIGDHKPPLIVIPHGGPIGVRDTASNDEVQHFLAANGMASLKVNYRGSGGFGKEFKELGKQQWGEKIESDIHTVVLKSIQQHNLNAEKVCAMGGSYGGYSAVMLTLLHPDMYKCAVSIHGVMDLPLLFGNKSLLKDDEFYDDLAEIVGDPKTELNKLINKSPLYLVEKMSRPIKLFQGLKDNRVTVEHALRMQQMFTLLKMDADLTVLMNEGHSLKHLNSYVYYVAESLKFFDKHLDLPIDIDHDEDQIEYQDSVLDYIETSQ